MPTQPYRIGFASSMFQTSGPRCGESDWTESARRGRVPDSTQPKPLWDNIDERLDRMKDVGATIFRISIEWSHVEPTPGHFDEAVLAQYEHLIDGCIARGIQPMLTLHHFNSPLWFSELGGFEQEKNIQYFVNYSKTVFSRFSSKVPLWCTINEPGVFAMMGYLLGKFPPHVKDSSTAVHVLKNLLQAHIDVYQALKAMPNGEEAKIGIVHNVLKFKSLYQYDPIAYAVKNHFNPISNDLVMEFFRTGRFYFPRTFRKDIEYTHVLAKTSNDFFGLNFYANPIVGPNLTNIYGPTCRKGQVMGDMFLPIDPVGFAEALDDLAQFGKPIYITETGVADKDDNDERRQKLLPLYFDIVDKKRAAGYDIPGVCMWTEQDNYEWDQGNLKSFGFFDREGKARPSVELLKKIIRDHTIIEQTEGQSNQDTLAQPSSMR